MCYQYPFAVLPVVVPAPESHRSVLIPLGMLVSLSESHGILRRGIISPPDGYSIVKVQGPSLVRTGEGALGGIFQKSFYLSTCSDWGDRFGHAFLKDLYFFDPLTCSHWEGHFGGVFCEKISPFTCSHWEPRFGRVFCDIIYPSTCSH